MDQQRLQAMQALMGRMGGEFTFGMGGGRGGGGANGELQKLLTKIKNHGDESEQLDGLNEFVNVLNMATEATIMSIHPQHYVGPIMACVTKQHNPELALVAARSLTYLVDANTHTVRVLQRDDHLSTLLDCLRSIMDVEFAEQVLTCVDKICTDDPAMVLQRDGVSAVMGFLDFFSITTQRLILHTVARMADVFRPQYYDKVESSLPTIRQCLRHDDNRMREEALTSLTRLVKRSSNDHACVAKVFGDAGPAVMEILEKRPTNAMFGTAIQLISTATHASAAVCEAMIQIGAVSFLAGLLEANNQSLMGAHNASLVGNASMVGDGSATSPLRPISASGNSPGSPLAASASAAGAAAAAGLTSTSTNAGTRIAHERVIDICNCLVSFAPDIVDTSRYINFIDTADSVRAKSPPAANASASAPAATSMGRRKGSSRGNSSSQPQSTANANGNSAAAQRRLERRAAVEMLRALRAAANGSGSDDDGHEDDPFDVDGEEDEDDEAEGFMDDEEEMGGDDDEEYEDFDPHSLSPEEQKAHLATLAAEGSLVIDDKPDKHRATNNGRHTCDVCGDRLSDPELWLRCNSRNDYDLCAACALELDGDEGHSFTWMKCVYAAPANPNPAASLAAGLSAAANAANAASASAKKQEALDQRALRVAMIKKAPYLVARLAEALPVMTRLHLNSDDEMIRGKCLTFICRVVHHTAADDLRAALLDCPMCELVTSLLTSERLSVLGRCIHICDQLMAKLPEIYTDLFIREGVTNGLAIVKSGVSVDKRAEAAAAPIVSVVAYSDGWRAILAHEANEILAKFEGSVDSGRIATMEQLCRRLRSDGEADPAEALRRAAEVLADISTFELMNSDLVGSILAMFTATSASSATTVAAAEASDEPNTAAVKGNICGGPEELVARFVSQLAAQPAENDQHYATLLGRFVHQLQSAVSQVEKFAPAFDGSENAKDPIRLVLKPHNPEEEAAAASKKDAEKKTKRGGGALKKKGSKKQSADDDAEENDNAAPSSTAATGGMKKTEGKTVTASTDPLASVAGIADFIRTNLLPNSPKNLSAPAGGGSSNTPLSASRRGGNGGGAADDEDAVEDIDPLASTSVSSPVAPTPPSLSFGGSSSPNDSANENATKRTRKETAAAAAAASAPPPPPPAAASAAGPTPLYLRYKTYALPPQWTMLQVMQTIVKKDREEASGGKKKPSRNDPETEGLPWQLRQLMGLAGVGGESVELVYSTEPFTFPTVTNLSAEGSGASATSSPGGAASSADRPVRFDPNLLPTSGAIAVRSALTKSYAGSAKFVPAGPLADVLRLINVLFAACSEWPSLMTWLAMRSGSYDLPKSLCEPRIAFAEFVNPKINSKAVQHASVVAMAGQHESAWYVRVLGDYPCLFTPATRRLLFELTYFGVSRSLVRLHELSQENGTLVDAERANAGRRQNRIVRRKCRVIREKPLECAMQVLSSSKATLGSVFEFEFKGEPGSGLGPTMEFYSLVGAALTGKRLGLWRASEEDSETNFTPTLGLYPAPFMGATSASAGSPTSSSTVASASAATETPQQRAQREEAHIIKHYTFLGRFLARVLLDRRIPNLRLSRPLLKMLRNDELAFDDIYCINPKLYEVLLAMAISERSGDRGQLASLPRPCRVEDLGLTFTLPGTADIPLVPNGEETEVTAESMMHYTQELATTLLCSSVDTAVRALREGFGSVISLGALRALTLDELAGTLKGHEEHISLAELEANVACDHGYSASSPTIRIFLEILSEMPTEGQQKFFQFLTGSATLPVGGLAALKPKFTIVRKTSSDPKVPEQTQLPSAMTCQNFLKLPAYDTKELMAQKLKMAIDEGANAFLFT